MALYWGGTKGGSDRVDCGNVTVGDSGDMSLCAWVRLPNSFSGAASIIDRRGGSATLHRFWILCVGDNAGKADFRYIRKHTTTDAVAISTQAYDTDDDTWYFVCGTHVAGAAPKLFVGTQTTDLAEVTYSSQTAPAGTLRTGAQPLNLGRQPTNTSTGFGGAIAVVGLFDTALSVGDLRAMRLGGLRTILSRTDLVHCWAPYLNGTSGTVYDIGARSIIAGTTIDGTISGTLTQIENPGLLRGFPAVGPADWRPVASAATIDALTADDLESASEVSSPNIGQSHALNASDVETASEVSAPIIGQAHGLTATDIESASEVSAPTIGQAHALTADDVESASEVSDPAIGQVHALSADDVEAASEVSNPAIADVGSGVHPLLAEDVETSSEVSAPAIGQVHVLTAESIESASEVTAPAVGQIHVLAANDTEAPSGVSSPAIGQVHMLVATDIASASAVSSPVLTHVIAGPISHIILAGFRRPGYRAPGGEPSSQAPGGRGRARTVGGGA